MDMKYIKELIAAMEKSGLRRLRIKEDKGLEIELERPHEHPHAPPPSPHHRHEPHHHFAAAPPPPPRTHEEEKKEAPKKGTFVSSPMVGTFYASPSPDDPPFVKVGDDVDENTVVCIIEAMKVMNEVKAGKKGKIAEIMVENADPVEFGTHLFRIV